MRGSVVIRMPSNVATSSGCSVERWMRIPGRRRPDAADVVTSGGGGGPRKTFSRWPTGMWLSATSLPEASTADV